MTQAARRVLAARLRVRAGEAAALEAKWLIEAAAGDDGRLEDMVARRLAGEPLDRIFGHRGFWTLDLSVTPAVLSPRPDTESIVQAARDHALQRQPQGPRRILDLGTGSGAILLALLAEFPAATGLGIDISADALAVAVANAGRNGLAERAGFLRGGWNAAAGRRFDVVTSNPPYIPSGDIPLLDMEVRAHDPLLALDGGVDGLQCYRDILPLLPAYLAPDGVAVLEIGMGQAADVTAMAEAAGLATVEIRRDFGNVQRAIVLAMG